MHEKVRTVQVFFLENYTLLWIFIFSSERQKILKNTITLQRVRRRLTVGRKDLINLTFEQMSKKLEIPALLGWLNREIQICHHIVRTKGQEGVFSEKQNMAWLTSVSPTQNLSSALLAAMFLGLDKGQIRAVIITLREKSLKTNAKGISKRNTCKKKLN